MSTITVTYHRDGTAWWADSADVPGFSAAGSSLAEVQGLSREGLEFLLEDPVSSLVETLEGGAVLAAGFHSDSVPGSQPWRLSWKSARAQAGGRPAVRPIPQSAPAL